MTLASRNFMMRTRGVEWLRRYDARVREEIDMINRTAIEAAERIVAADNQYSVAHRLKKAWAWDVYKDEAAICGATVARALLSSAKEGERMREALTADELALAATAMGHAINWWKRSGYYGTKFAREEIAKYKPLIAKLDAMCAALSATERKCKPGDHAWEAEDDKGWRCAICGETTMTSPGQDARI